MSEELSGETLSEASIIHMSDALRSDPAFSSVSLTSFERVNPAVPAAGIRFRMTMSSPAQLAPPTTTPGMTASNATPKTGGKS